MENFASNNIKSKDLTKLLNTKGALPEALRRFAQQSCFVETSTRLWACQVLRRD